VEFLSLLAGTVLLRPYVFVFLALYLFLASRQIGWARTLLWTATGYALALSAEYGSIHWGFPFGDYYYIDATRDRELWVAGVPFMDSLSFTFLSYIGFSCAWQLEAGFRSRQRPLSGAEYRAARRSVRVVLLGALITTLMDVVIDPVTLMGDRWFLGLIYGYAHEGRYFGIPLSNFAGWALLSGAIIGVNLLLDPRLPNPANEQRRPAASGSLRGPAMARRSLSGQKPLPGGGRLSRLPFLHLGGFVLFLFVVGFNLAVTAWLGEIRLLLAGLALVLVFLAASWRVLSRGGLFEPRAP